MVTTNGPSRTVPKPSVGNHPRRVPAHKSVSLRQSPPAPSRNVSNVRLLRQPSSTSPDSASDKANPPSVSPKFLSNKHSSGESSDAGRWFETTNNKAQQSSSFADNEPPFFLRNSSSSETPPEDQSAHYARMRSTMPYRPALADTGTDGSSTEDFRSVIDDLTVANKRLKQKLRKYEKVHDAHLQQDKLFEVRFHGLPDHKKKELEETLRKFAAGLDDTSTDYPQASSHTPALEQQKTASSMSRFAESGYASMSASGQNSSAPSNQASNQAEDRKMSRSAYNRQQQSIQSYLHDIPAGLLPNQNVPMSDKAKKKLVVRRLEQIFAGKRSIPGNHPQPMQQEEVAQSAATADREEREATGRQHRPEGARVARILPDRDGKNDAPETENLQKFRPSLHIDEQDFAGSGSPDQRPTRPLDLDPSRAQVPDENMDYIRHLGFTPPDMVTGETLQEGHGWLYLNLLINMAQLHTLNVTPEFVKDALTDYSGHLELSHDGRKVRWKGGLDVTRHSSDNSSEFDSSNSPYEHASPSKRLKTDDSMSTEAAQLNPEQRARKLARAQREKELNKFAYTPMFFQKEDSEDEDEGYGFENESSGVSLQRPQHAGNSSGLGSSAAQSGTFNKRKREDGPMIFYTKARFYTDLSGDRLGSTALPVGAYKTVTSKPIGATASPHSSSRRSSDIGESRGPMDVTPMDTDSSNYSHTASSDELFGFSPAALRNDSGNDSPAEIMNFEASGLGGVQPDDNFSIRVRRAQTQTAQSGTTGRRRSSLYPKKIYDALTEQSSPKAERASSQPVIKEEILSASTKTLPTSALPPASFLPFDSTSSGDVDSDLDDSDVSSEPESQTEEDAGTALQLLNVSPMPSRRFHDGSQESSGEESDYSDDDSDDGSVDLLATARQLDPNTVRTQEREYDAAVADRLAEDIVAGSSAATAGGGSGFNSPADGVLRADGTPNLKRQSSSRKTRHSTTSGSASARSQLKRTPTSENAAMKEKIRKTDE